MTRIRLKPTADQQDGGAFNPGNRPPGELLPPAFAKAFKELDATRQRISAARADLASATDQATRLEAQRTDRLNSAEAARNGDTTGATAAVDSLDRHERQARADIEALEGALDLIRDDLAAQRELAQADVERITKTETAARERLAKALTESATHATAVAQAIALREWVVDHAPYDPSVSINILDIWTPASRVVSGADSRIPVNLDAIAIAINDL